MDESKDGEVMISFPTLVLDTSAVVPRANVRPERRIQGGGGNAHEKDNNESGVGWRDPSTPFLETSAIRPTWQHKTEETEVDIKVNQLERSTKGGGESKGDPRCLPTLVRQTLAVWPMWQHKTEEKEGGSERPGFNDAEKCGVWMEQSVHTKSEDFGSLANVAT